MVEQPFSKQVRNPLVALPLLSSDVVYLDHMLPNPMKKDPTYTRLEDLLLPGLCLLNLRGRR